MKQDSRNQEEQVKKANVIDSLGQKQGLWTKEIASNIIDSMYFLDGQLHGSYKSYFKSGNLRHYGQYEHGKISGTWNYYNKEILVS